VTSVKVPLGAYHASLVGNPWSASPATVSGFDYAAVWDQGLNNGHGGYRLSGYRQAQTIGVGAGLWVFSFSPTTIDVVAS
jgi:hypothetical protein